MKMSVTLELLDALKASQDNASDYRVAKLLGVTQQTISKYRVGQSPISAEKMIIACELAGLDPVEWLIKLQAERAKCDAEKDIWNGLLTRTAA
jgi:predicted transcriptional regulator